jgi:hypothetical protein
MRLSSCAEPAASARRAIQRGEEQLVVDAEDLRRARSSEVREDSRAARPGDGPFVVVRNSWGSTFMEDGYGYMSFDYANKYANDAVEYVLP